MCAGDEIQPADLKLVPLLPPADRRGAPSAVRRRAPVFGGYRPPAARRRARRRAPRRRRPPADARSRLPAVFDELLREGGDGLFDAVERALVHAAFEHAHRNQVRTAQGAGRHPQHGAHAAQAPRPAGGRRLRADADADAERDAGDGDAAEHGGRGPELDGGRFSLSAA